MTLLEFFRNLFSRDIQRPGNQVFSTGRPIEVEWRAVYEMALLEIPA
jgi:hypothetical protein